MLELSLQFSNLESQNKYNIAKEYRMINIHLPIHNNIAQLLGKFQYDLCKQIIFQQHINQDILSMSQPQTIICKAAVAYAPNQPLVIEEIEVDPPKAGEVRIKVISNALCHTDVYTLDGCDPEGVFPVILGHEATGIVESVGPGVTRVKVGDIVIPCYTPQCQKKSCIYCEHPNTNLCPAIRATQGRGLMPDQTSRFRNKQKKTIYHFMGCSTFSEYTVIAEISAAKINPNADLNKVCMIGCGVSTGWGAVMNNCDVEPGSTVAVWGLGAVGLSVIQGAKIRGASKIYAIDINDKKFQIARKFGADVCYQPTPQKDGKAFLLQNEKWGVNYTFDATGNTLIMRQALESAHRGFGESCVIGVAASGKEIATRSFQLVTGRKWLGTAFGGWKSAQDVPKLVNKTVTGEWPIDAYVTHEYEGLQKVNESVDELHKGSCLRAVVKISPPPKIQAPKIRVTGSARLEEGVLQTVEHYSESVQGFMTFNIFLPDAEISKQRGRPYPALYFLAGLTANHENAPVKSGFAKYAKKHRLAVVFPDTSPRKTNIDKIAEDWEFGESASYYIDATSEAAKKHFQMFTYITKQLPELVSTYFPVDKDIRSITGFSMGGHGALIAGLKTGLYRSVSAFAPMANPTKCLAWGIKGYKFFFNDPQVEGLAYDATQILKSGNYYKVPLLVEVGSNDQFKDKLLSQNLKNQLIESNYDHTYKVRLGYNHSFWYVSTFIEEHFDFHAKYLNWYA